MPDVDIDFFDRDNTLKLFKHTPASIFKDGKSEKHKTGVYFHAVPEHPVTGRMIASTAASCSIVRGSSLDTIPKCPFR